MLQTKFKRRKRVARIRGTAAVRTIWPQHKDQILLAARRSVTVINWALFRRRAVLKISNVTADLEWEASSVTDANPDIGGCRKYRRVIKDAYVSFLFKYLSMVQYWIHMIFSDVQFDVYLNYFRWKFNLHAEHVVRFRWFTTVSTRVFCTEENVKLN